MITIIKTQNFNGTWENLHEKGQNWYVLQSNPNFAELSKQNELKNASKQTIAKMGVGRGARPPALQWYWTYIARNPTLHFFCQIAEGSLIYIGMYYVCTYSMIPEQGRLGGFELVFAGLCAAFWPFLKFLHLLIVCFIR